MKLPETAIVMAAGFGTRMRPLTDTIPKPLVKVAGKPLIDHALDWLAASGVQKAVVNSHYLAEIMEAHLRARGGNPQIIISRENEILETGGGVKNALPLLGDAPFFVINSDVIAIDGDTPTLEKLARNFDADTMDAMLLLHKLEDAIGYDGAGDFFMDDGKLRRRVEGETAPLVFTGIQILHPRLFENSPDGKFSLNIFYKDLKRIGAIIHDGSWLHIGDKQGLEQAENWFSNRR